MATTPGVSVANRYQDIPLAFEPYTVPVASHSQVRFVARGNGYAMFLAPHETVIALRNDAGSSSALHMKLEGASRPPQFASLDELPGKSNYLSGKNPADWRTGVPTFRKVAERGVYDGIDLVYYGNRRQLEYDFIVSPGADPRAIQLAFQGAENLRVDTQQGDLVIALNGGEIRMHQPVAYQEPGGAKQLIAAKYVIRNDRSVAFEVARYDANLPLVIDPTLAYSTYLGGSDIDGANAIAVAPDGTAFIAGGTFSLNFPTAHPLQPNHNGPDDFSRDAFVAKISADGSTLLYSTYLGGKEEDVANGIAVDTFGNAYVTGTTLSPDFPVTPGSFNTLCGGDGKCGATWNPQGLVVENAFVSKLNPAGSALIYSGFLGEYENVGGQAIAVDNDQIAYVTGQTGPNIAPTVPIVPPAVGPPPFPIVGAFQTAFGGGDSDAFVTKISATGTTIEYSTYAGGSNENVGHGLAVDGAGNVYVTGLTYAADFPVLNALQGAAGGAGDAFVSKINTRVTGAGSLVYSTYLGGSGLDQGNGIAIDSTGNAYIAGTSASTSFVFTPNGFQISNHGQGDAFAAKLTPTGGLSYFTFLGGSLADSGAGIAVDPSGDAYITGSTVSTDFPVTSPVFQHSYGGGNADAFVAKLNPTGTALLYSSYLGGSNTELAGGIAVDTAGAAYVAGQTCSQDFPLANPLQASANGNCDAYVAKVSLLGGLAFSPAGLVFPAQNLGTTSAPMTVTVTNTSTTTSVGITSLSLTGANAGDFVQTNNCPASLAVGAQCGLTVTFHPSDVGTRTASLIVSDTGVGGPHTIALTGSTSSGQNGDFTISTASPSAAVPAGQSAAYNLTITPFGGFAQPIALSCTGLPRGAGCSFSQNPATPTGSGTVTVTVSVSTALRAMVGPTPRNVYPTDWSGWDTHVLSRPWLLSLVIFVSLFLLAGLKRRRGAVAFGSAVALLLLCSACSGGSQAGVPAGTPAGSYQVNVVGTSGSLTHSTAVTLQVN